MAAGAALIAYRGHVPPAPAVIPRRTHTLTFQLTLGPLIFISPMEIGLSANCSAALSALPSAAQTVRPLLRWDPEGNNYFVQIAACAAWCGARWCSVACCKCVGLHIAKCFGFLGMLSRKILCSIPISHPMAKASKAPLLSIKVFPTFTFQNHRPDLPSAWWVMGFGVLISQWNDSSGGIRNSE